MKSSHSRLSVGLVGFLRQETPISCASTDTLVGFPENLPQPDHKPDHEPIAASTEQGEIDRIIRLDIERREADRLGRRGYDFDSTAPSYAEYMSRANPRAYSIIATCRRYGLALRIDPDGALIVGKAGARAEEPTQPCPSLIHEIEAHIGAVASLVEGGWHLRADFPQGEVA